jgi:hypothetical protein
MNKSILYPATRTRKIIKFLLHHGGNAEFGALGGIVGSGSKHP